jgi:predicted dienelactone hydrolase
LRHAQEITRSGPNDREGYLYRLDEMKFVLNRILESEPFGKIINREKITIGGHSLGGFTALGLCGTIGERRDNRIKALLLFSTGAGGYLFRESELASVKAPSMYFFGEREKDQKRGTETMGELSDKIYRNLPPPKYLLEVRRTNHFSFNNCFNNRAELLSLCGTEEQFKVIRRYSIAFLEKHGAGKKDADGILEQQDPLLSRYLREPSK